MPCLPCKRLNAELTALNDCYPPSKELVKAAPEYQPLSQDLGKLTYIATNKPSSLAKIGDELEKRVIKEAKGSSGGYPKSRASLLISLRVLHRLLTECKRDIGLFARQTMRIISTALDVRVYQKNDTDLEVASRAAACFAAFATFTDGGGIGVDDGLTNSYLGVLGKFANLACCTPQTEKFDAEEQSRARLIGLSALSATAGSDAVFSASVEFPRQVKIIVPALLKIIHPAPFEDLKQLAAKAKPGSTVAYFSEFQARRSLSTRRLPSLHEHVPGEKGPSTDDVTSAAFTCLYNLVSECQSNQAEKVLGVLFAYLDQYGWSDVERDCWLAEQLTVALPLQSRSIVPTSLVDMLLDLPDDVPPTVKHLAIVSMVTTVLSSSVSLVGLGVTDILAQLIAVITRRVSVNPVDELLPALVKCVSSLGTHIYYADQINDIVEEITTQMAMIPTTDPARQNILRVLIHGMMGVMSAADLGDEAEARASEMRAVSPSTDRGERVDKGKSPQLESPAVEIPRRDLGRRNPIAPEVWQETLPLLCESTFAVRAAYVRTLLFYLETEMPRDRRPRPDEPNIVRFCNALNAAVYTLAMSSCLGVGDPISSLPHTPGDGTPPAFQHENRVATPESVNDSKPGVTFTVSEPTPRETPAGSVSNHPKPAWPGTFNPGANGTATPRSGGNTPGAPNGSSGAATPKRPVRHGRRVSLPINRLNSATELTQFDNVATPFDYAFILRILGEVHKTVPVAALTTGAPMLLALDADAGNDLQRSAWNAANPGAWVLERKRACRETVAIVWRRIAATWGVQPVMDLADRAINSLPEPFVVPEFYLPDFDVLRPDEPNSFVRDSTEGESAAASHPLLDPTVIVQSFANFPEVQRASAQNEPELERRLGAKWTAESAIRESFERFTSHSPPPDSSTAAAAATLMAIPNGSYQSFGRPMSRAVDVTDLRDALGAGGGGATGSASQSVVSSLHSTSPANEKKAKARPDASEVLKEIFKDKKRA